MLFSCNNVSVNDLFWFVELLLPSPYWMLRRPGTGQVLCESFLHGACKDEWSKGFHYTFLKHLTALECLFMQFQRPALPLHAHNLRSDEKFTSLSESVFAGKRRSRLTVRIVCHVSCFYYIERRYKISAINHAPSETILNISIVICFCCWCWQWWTTV